MGNHYIAVRCAALEGGRSRIRTGGPPSWRTPSAIFIYKADILIGCSYERSREYGAGGCGGESGQRVSTVPGLDTIVALHAALGGHKSGRSQCVPMVRDYLLAEVAPVLDLFLRCTPVTHTSQAPHAEMLALQALDWRVLKVVTSLTLASWIVSQ